MKQKLLNLTLILILFTVLASSCSKQEKPAAESLNKTVVKENSPQINFTMTTLDGREMQLSDYYGKVLVIDMWDTWCPPCRMEIPHFIELYNEYHQKGFEMIGIAFGREGADAVRKFVRENGVNYTNALANQEIMSQFGEINSIPTTFVIDQKGKIYKKYIGLNAKAIFEKDIKTLLSQGNSISL
jgi:thiol-disulfide isomerase/thioredoxin